MKATPARLKAIFWLFAVGSALGVGLFVFNVVQRQYAFATMTLGFTFSMLSLAVNPQSVFKDIRDPATWDTATDPRSRTSQYLAKLTWICYIGALVMFLIGRFKT
jgi:hypothetical protein